MGINQQDLNLMTEFWQQETGQLNDQIDSTLKSAQDHSYAIGYRRGRDDLIEIRKQRDELLAELLRVKEICLRECGVGIVNEVVIASVKGGSE